MSWAEVWSVTRSNWMPRAGDLGEHVGGVSEDADRHAPPVGGVPPHPVDGVVQVVGDLVEVARLEAALDPMRVDLDVQARRPAERRGQRLGAAHPAEPGREDGAPRQVGRAPVGLTGRGERLVGALEDPLRADVDPRPRRHLPEHREPLGLEPAELVPGGESGHEERVGEKHARGAGMGAEDGDGLPALDEQRLVVLEPKERRDDRLQRLVAPGGPPGSAVDDEPLRDPRPPRDRGCCRAS